MPLTVSRMCKSRFAEHYPLIQLYPTAAPPCGLQWVSHRGVPSAHPVRIKSVMYFSSKLANFKFYAICLIKTSEFSKLMA